MTRYVTSVQEESDPVDHETDEVEDITTNNKSSKGPSNSDAFSALETAKEWYEQQSECCPTQPLLLKRIRDLEAKKRRSPDPSVCDSFLRVTVKSKVYRNSPHSVQELQPNIADEMAALPTFQLRSVFHNFLTRAQTRQEMNGGHFQHLL
ncbi:hypothetical protein TNCV_2209671 [Trichonephila clavipes]|nr:hypothetical protein TNCV_2209671 [Trichonephila clavipes]